MSKASGQQANEVQRKVNQQGTWLQPSALLQTATRSAATRTKKPTDKNVGAATTQVTPSYRRQKNSLPDKPNFKNHKVEMR